VLKAAKMSEILNFSLEKNLMISWDEKKIKILVLLSMAQTLKRKAEASFYLDRKALIDEYSKLLEILN